MSLLRRSEQASWLDFIADSNDELERFITILSTHVPRTNLRRKSDTSLEIPMGDVEFAISRGWRPVSINIDSVLRSSLIARKNDRERILENEDPLDESEIFSSLEGISLHRTPTDFQMKNIRQMARYKLAATFSVPGSGKTSEAILYWLAKKRPNERLLVVLPKVASTSWREELHAWLGWDESEIHLMARPADYIYQNLIENKEKCVFIVNYQKMLIATEPIARFMAETETDGWSMILDESHNIKNYRGSTSIAARQLGSYVDGMKMILTGTPAPQGPEDLRAQAEFLQGIQMDEESSRELIQSIFVRTSKDDLELKPATIQIHEREHKPEHAAIYNGLFDEARQALLRLQEGDYSIGNQARAAQPHMMTLRKAATDPSVLDRSAEDVRPWKYDFILEAAYRARENSTKLIIWSNFRHNLLALCSLLGEFSPAIVYGAIPSDRFQSRDIGPTAGTREWQFDRFKNNDSCSVLIANPAACGESISLHHWCNEAIYLDRSYNAAHYLQSMDRIHRFGMHPDTGKMTCRDNPVTYHVLNTVGTIDQRIHERLEEKIQRQRDILESGDFSQPLEEPGTDIPDDPDVSDSTGGSSHNDILDFLAGL